MDRHVMIMDLTFARSRFSNGQANIPKILTMEFEQAKTTDTISFNYRTILATQTLTAHEEKTGETIHFASLSDLPNTTHL